MAKPKEIVRAYRNYDVDELSDATGLECLDPSRTIQSQAADADINTIVRNFGLTGRVPENIRTPSYGDFEGVDDFRSALEAVRAAEEAFLQVPAEIRLRFDNDPQRYLEFCTDLNNLPEMRKLGLAKPLPDPVPDKVDA